MLQALHTAATQQAVTLKYLTPHLIRTRLRAKPDSITAALVAPVLQYVISDAPSSGAWAAEMTAELHNLPLLLLRPSTSESGASAEHTTPLNIALIQTSNATAKHWLCSNADVAVLPDLLPDSSAVGVVDTSIRAFIAALEICIKACILRNVKVGIDVHIYVHFLHVFGLFSDISTI